MAAKKREETERMEPTPETLTAATDGTEQVGNAPDKDAPEHADPDQTGTSSAWEQEKAPALESLSELANRHRLTTWQQAALLRFMDWTDDKRVSEAEYAAALDGLKPRRIGGGRR